MLFQKQLEVLKDKEYRESYLETQVCSGIAYQIQALRKKTGLSQKQFAAKLNKPQSVISRLENTEYGKVSIQTLLDVASALKIALVVKFCSFQQFISVYDNVSESALLVDDIDETLEYVEKKYGQPNYSVELGNILFEKISAERNMYPVSSVVLLSVEMKNTPLTIEGTVLK